MYVRPISTRLSRGRSTLAIRATLLSPFFLFCATNRVLRVYGLALSLFMLGVLTNHHDSTATSNDAAFLTHFSDRCSNFHAFFGNTASIALYHLWSVC